ncbi:hypothetical protein CYLTODRAFT_361750 [Cylindrobasidium torrendii FP15055 ss-10]|uniref:Protein BIG1 n=1 Tax=Cylindrobasidium torrendii FP15055 ss-10 TaxID=1314674 RepID=A0A0D7AWA8_9AGAR|nr:hypothetical protein CYLTODRAFT_361750 [Cylindrobasidium torrendii FP15055 ss-10]
MARLALSLLALLPAALAFKDTAPIVAWSSHQYVVHAALDRLAETSSFDSIIVGDDLCAMEAIVIIDQPGLHASDLRRLPSSSHVARSLKSAASSQQIPYVPATNVGDLAAFAESLAERCASRLVSLAPGIGGISLDGSAKSVVVVNMPEISGARGEAMVRHGAFPLKPTYAQVMKLIFYPVVDALLESTLAKLPFASHLTLLSASFVPHSHSKRAVEETPVLSLKTAKQNKGGILARYQLLTPGLITVLLVVLFILLPILYFSIGTLASIQSPVRMDAPKGFSATERKRQ